jgi:hypothetical protein
MKDSARLWKLLPSLVLVSLAFAAPPAAAEVGDAASGSGTNDAGDTFNFDAVGGPGDSATGTMHYAATAGFFTATAVVDCLRVVGNAATVGGTVTTSNFPEFVGNDVFFYAHDNGPLGAGDEFEDAFHETPFDCHDPVIGFPLIAGDIVVTGGAGDDDDDDEDDDDQGEDNDNQGLAP